MRHHKKNRDMDEDRVTGQTDRMIQAAAEHRGEVIIVTNEVEPGIVPENKNARLYRAL